MTQKPELNGEWKIPRVETQFIASNTQKGKMENGKCCSLDAMIDFEKITAYFMFSRIAHE